MLPRARAAMAEVRRRAVRLDKVVLPGLEVRGRFDAARHCDLVRRADVAGGVWASDRWWVKDVGQVSPRRDCPARRASAARRCRAIRFSTRSVTVRRRFCRRRVRSMWRLYASTTGSGSGACPSAMRPGWRSCIGHLRASRIELSSQSTPVVVRGVGVVSCPRPLSSTRVRMYDSRWGARWISSACVMERASASVQQELIDRIGDEVSAHRDHADGHSVFARTGK